MRGEYVLGQYMPHVPQVEELSLEFVRKNETNNPHHCPRERQEYMVRSTLGVFREAVFPWGDAQVHEDLDQLNALRPNDVAVSRLGKCLRAFLDTVDWAADEQTLEMARVDKRPIHLTILSHAAEIYHLPWELLPLRVSGTRLGELPELLIRYAWPGTHSQVSAQETVRIVLAGSAAGEHVPFQEHQKALRHACQLGEEERGLKVELLVVANASRRSLARALSDPARPVNVLHLLCHGKRLKDDACGLVLNSEDSDDGPDDMSPAGVQQLFSTLRVPPRSPSLWGF